MESALVQTVLALAIVLGAALFLARRVWRSVARRAPTDGAGVCGPDGGCGCSVKSPADAASSRSSR